MFIPKKRFFESWLLVLLLSCMCLSCHAGGIVIYKTKSHQSDNYAKVASYKSMQNKGAISVFRLENGKHLEFNNYTWRMAIPFQPTEGYDIIDQTTISSLKEAKAEYAESMKRFPQAAPYLKTEIAKVNLILNKWEQGYIRLSNKWISKAQHELDIANKERERIKKEEQMKAEVAQFKKDQEAKKREQLKLQYKEKREHLAKGVSDLKRKQEELKSHVEKSYDEYIKAQESLQQSLEDLSKTLSQ